MRWVGIADIPVRAETQYLLVCEIHDGERLVDLVEVDVPGLEPGMRQGLRRVGRVRINACAGRLALRACPAPRTLGMASDGAVVNHSGAWAASA